MKRITKYYNFSRTKEVDRLPKYVNDHISANEKIIVAYTTIRDHGIFTDQKIILFDNRMAIKEKREILVIPYSSISIFSILYKANSSMFKIYLNNGTVIKLRFIRMIPTDKMRIRYLSTIIMQIINKQEVDKNSVTKLINNDFKID